MRALLLSLLLTLPGLPAAAEAAWPAPWAGARWGMTPAALDRAVPGLVALAPPWAYGGGLEAPRALRRTDVAGLEMRALFQTGADGRLAQVLFERRRPALRPGDGPRALAALRARLGPEARLCLDRGRPGGPVSAEAVWPGATGVWRLVWVDHGAGEGLDDLHEAEIRRRLRAGEVEAAHALRREARPPGALRRSLPRRLLIRWSDPRRPAAAGHCPPAPKPRPAQRGAGD